jgi:hypothetical protein
MRLLLLPVLLFLLPSTLLVAQEGAQVQNASGERKVTHRRVYTEPPTEGPYRVIRRIYRPVKPEEARSQPPAKPVARPDSKEATTPQERRVLPPEVTKPKHRYFVGAGFGYVMRERSVVVDTIDNGERIDVGGRIEEADGSSYSLTQDESELSPSLELGVLGGVGNYYGAKLTLYQEFVEFSGFAGMRLEPVFFKGFTPYLQSMVGIGYESFSGLSPDNLTLGVGLGVDHMLVGDRLLFNLMLSYQHRFWQGYKKSYGTEHWRDSEVGLLGGFRYAF